MTDEQKTKLAALQEIVNHGASKQGAFDEVDGECQKATRHYEALRHRRDELAADLANIAKARAELIALKQKLAGVTAAPESKEIKK